MTYTSKAQLARILSEGWIAANGYCLACECDLLLQTAANTQARDFECRVCRHPYEVKSSIRPFGRKVVDGAFSSMMRRIESSTVPSFLLLRYSDDGTVTDLTAVHRSLITPELIERRKPLSHTARRAGWVGCNLLLHGIPPEGRIELVSNGVASPKHGSRASFMRTEKLSSATLGERSWACSVLSCLHTLPHSTFSLLDAYGFEQELAALHPMNRNVRAKIRQQLQLLRNAGLLIFVSRGIYSLALNRPRPEEPLIQ
jgi:type II restriction enzyme